MYDLTFPRKVKEHAARLAKLSLTDNQLIKIAKVAVLWNSAERKLQVFIGELLQRPVAGEFVTVDLGNVAIVQLARNLTVVEIENQEARDYIDAALELFDLCRAARNYVIHGSPSLDTDTPQELFTRSAKNGKGRVSVRSADVSEPRLDELIETLCILNFAIDACTYQAFALMLVKLRKLRKEGMMPPFVRISLIQDLNKKLRPRPPNNPKHQPPLRSSRA